MIKVEKLEVYGFDPALRGMRNPMNSWDKSDSHYCDVLEDACQVCTYQDPCPYYEIGENDLDLCQRLVKGGSEHRKFARMIIVWCDITSPLYWWKEADTYKFMEKNSCSTMHKLLAKPIEMSDFSFDDPDDDDVFIVENCEYLRQAYLKTKDVKIWRKLIQRLPSAYMQKRTVMFSYETVMNIIRQRKNHKLSEWREFVQILEDLPYMRAFLTGAEKWQNESNTEQQKK